MVNALNFKHLYLQNMPRQTVGWAHFQYKGYFSFLKKKSNRIMKANSEDPDQTPLYAVSDLGLHWA